MFRTTILAAWFGLAATAFANSPELSPQDKDDAEKLVAKLGDASFKVRESATAKLVKYGRAVEPVLRKGLTSEEAEVRRRCEWLIPLAVNYDLDKQIAAFLSDKDGKHVTLPGWAKFKEVAGSGDDARMLFVDLHRIDTAYIEMIEKDPKAAAKRLGATCQEWNNRLSMNWGRVAVTPDQIAFLLYPYLAVKDGAEQSTQQYFINSLHNMANQPGGKQILTGDPVIRKMLITYFEQQPLPWNWLNFNLISQLEIPEGAGMAKKALKNSATRGGTRAMAIALLGRVGTPANLEDVEPFLSDTTNWGSAGFGANQQVRTQVRDVALAVAIEFTGQSLEDYNFPGAKVYGRDDRKRMLMQTPTMLGFSNDEGRTAAFKKWTEWREKNKK